ncbi:hypothetical protein NB713_000329 [Xanthomonas sacchari]|nr:hypothetical protein [Xanthomonas sacchari]
MSSLLWVPPPPRPTATGATHRSIVCGDWFASPTGRRCPAGADEGTGVASCAGWLREGCAPVPSPQPLSRRERGSRLSLPPPGEGTPQGRMRVRAQSRAQAGFPRAAPPYPPPQPLSRRERGSRLSLLPPGEGAPQGRMRVRAQPRAQAGFAMASPRTITPTPLPQGEGLAPFPSPTGRRCPVGADEGTGAASCAGWLREGCAPVPSPQPLSRRERGARLSLLPPGEGAPQGRMRVRAQPRAQAGFARASPRTLTPTPLPRGEGLARCAVRPRHTVRHKDCLRPKY